MIEGSFSFPHKPKFASAANAVDARRIFTSWIGLSCALVATEPSFWTTSQRDFWDFSKDFKHKRLFYRSFKDLHLFISFFYIVFTLFASFWSLLSSLPSYRDRRAQRWRASHRAKAAASGASHEWVWRTFHIFSLTFHLCLAYFMWEKLWSSPKGDEELRTLAQITKSLQVAAIAVRPRIRHRKNASSGVLQAFHLALSFFH